MNPPPPHPLPLPLACSEQGSFAENTLLVRLPEIARRVIKENDFPETINRRIIDFIEELPDGLIGDLDDPGAPDVELWRAYLEPWQGLSWRDLSFLAAENTFYRRVLASTGYFQPGSSLHVDPYAYQKSLALEVSRKSIQSLAEKLDAWRQTSFSPTAALEAAIESNLWGNRADLSLWPADAEGTLPNSHLHQSVEFMVVNDISQMIDFILNPQTAHRRIDFLIDNAGFELVCDLALSDLLLDRGWADQIVFHLKKHPTFVSDALVEDVKNTIHFLCAEPGIAIPNFGRRIAHAVAHERLILEDHYFWNSPLPAWDMPPALLSHLSDASLVISKGDANYRRLLGDLHWPETSTFQSILAYFPTRLAVLRTCKSHVIVGLRAGQAAWLEEQDLTWRTSGRWGLIQFYNGRGGSA
jgi:hypothetical protein